MKTALFFVLALSLTATTQAAPERPKAKPSANRLLCKTGPEKRAPGQALRLYFNYNLPFIFEPEDPTLPFGRQVMLLAGRPVVQMFFEKASGPAGVNGELLQPMQCAFAHRALRSNEPSQVQILLGHQPQQVSWLSQPIGQRAGVDRANLTPPGDWTFASLPEQVFAVELEDTKTFVSSQIPR